MLSATGINQDRANKCGSRQGWERKNHLPSALGGLTLGTHWWILDCNCGRHTNGRENLDIIHQKKTKEDYDEPYKMAGSNGKKRIPRCNY